MAKDMAQEVGESKTCVQPVNKPWIAMCVDLRDHDIVGMKAGKRPWTPFQMWAWMLFEAARFDRQRVIQGRKLQLARGQFAMSLRYLSRESKWGVKEVRRFLARLRKHDMITVEVTAGTQMSLDFAAREMSDVCPKRGTGLTVVTVCNYIKYQHTPNGKGTGRAQQGHSRGTAGAQDKTRDTGQRDTHRSPSKGSTSEDTRENSEPSGTDGELGDRLPFTDAALATCEAMGFARKTVVDRYWKRTKGRKIHDPSAYLIEMATDMAAKARGVSKDALRATLSNNATERAAAFGQAAGAPQEPTAPMRKIVTRRCQHARRDPIEMLAAWQASIKGTRLLHVDQHVDSCCSSWRREQKEAA